MNKKNRDNNAGFTLVEIIVTLVILAIVAAFTVPALGGFIEDAHARDCQAKRTDLAKAYTTQLVDDGVANPGSTIDIANMETVLQAKGAIEGDGIETAVLDTQSDDAGVITYGQYTGLCPDGGVYAIKTKPTADGGQVVFYLECSKHGVVDVCQGANALSVVSIQITKTPTKTIYNKGEEFTAAGGEIEVTFKDKDGKQTTKNITMTNTMCSKPDMQQVGDNQSVTVSYGGKTASFTIDVKENIQLTALSITTPPTKTTYYVGESFNPAGMVVTATYSDGSQKPVTDYTITAPDTMGMQSVGTKDIGVSYTEGDITKTATWQSITVKLVQVRIVDANGIVAEYTDTVSGESTALKQAVKDVKDNQTIQIVVANYRLNPDVQVNPAGGGDEGIGISKNVTITTAQDIVGGPSRIYTNSQTASNLFQVKDSNATLTLDNIVLDGGNTGENSSGATCRVAYVSKGKVVVTGATIKNFTLSKTNLFYGGAFALKTEGELSIKGSTIENCTINSDGGTGEIISNGGAIAAGGTTLVTLGEGTVIRGCSAQYGGALSVVTETNKSSTTPVTLDGAKIENCTAVNQGGAINLISNSSLNIRDTSITGCSSPTGAIYAGGTSTTLGGTVQITENSQPVEAPSPCNLYLPGNKNLTIGEGGLTETASIGVTMGDKTREANGKQFATAAEENARNIDKLFADINPTLGDDDKLYGKEIGDKAIVWRSANYVPVCQLLHGETITPYDGDSAIQNAMKAAADGDTIEILQANYTVKAKIDIDRNITITKGEKITSVILTDSITNGDALFTMKADGKTATIKDLSLTSAQANSRAIYQTSGMVAFENVTMNGFKSTGNGGGIYISNATLKIKSSKLQNCVVSGSDTQGGAIWGDKAQISLDDSTIQNCQASGTTGSGGGIYIKDTTSKLRLDKTTIKDCSATQYGGAITTYSSPIAITNSTIENCSCTQTTGTSGGGAIRAANSGAVEITSTTIKGCHAIQGGVFSSGASTVTITGGSITGNYADDGALMDCYGRSADISALNLKGDLKVTANGKSTEDKTTAIVMNSDTDGQNPNTRLNISGTVQINNNAIKGSKSSGLIGTGEKTLIMTLSENAQICNNVVAQGAGGIYVNEKSTLNVADNVQITKNTSGTDGSKIVSNVLLTGAKKLNVTDNLGNGAKIGVTAEGRMSVGQQFGTRKTNTTTIPEGCFTADTVGLYGAAEGTSIKWANSIQSIAFKNDGKKYFYPKTVYKTGEAFSTEGGILTATYSDSTTKDIDLSQASCSGYDLSKAGAQTVVVTYKGVTTTYSIIVQEAPPVDDKAKQCIQKLASMLYGESYAVWYWNACTYYNGFTHNNNRFNGAVLSSKDGYATGGSWITDKYVYGNTNTLLASAADISDIDRQYVWAVVPNSRDGGYDSSSGISNADDYGYTIIWCTTNGLTGSEAIQSGKSYTVMVYDTKLANYRNGTITAASKNGNTYLNTATLKISE
ncbi:MAG: bacterial Ig-like domain-containing protein [Eubacterium aggregans]|uniref:bacterial Ig-like domain-containing protein n=1 Tax=Eubacterium aggregans TaxID=81409 RepID=UPI002B211D8A|nr:bacterial Ig-like domain-containing protein [Eubacterium aggregans]MEA5072561.1 bacterial Ig-like domain-containing protein [Eubacterium aggregans]